MRAGGTATLRRRCNRFWCSTPATSHSTCAPYREPTCWSSRAARRSSRSTLSHFARPVTPFLARTSFGCSLTCAYRGWRRERSRGPCSSRAMVGAAVTAVRARASSRSITSFRGVAAASRSGKTWSLRAPRATGARAIVCSPRPRWRCAYDRGPRHRWSSSGSPRLRCRPTGDRTSRAMGCLRRLRARIKPKRSTV
jgi:hypothetical protein